MIPKISILTRLNSGQYGASLGMKSAFLRRFCDTQSVLGQFEEGCGSSNGVFCGPKASTSDDIM